MSSAQASKHPLLWRSRLATAFSRPVLKKACMAALVVGSIHILINQGDVLLSRQFSHRLLVKSLVTPIIPFCVTMLGAILNSNTALPAAVLRPGWMAIKRSLIIAIIVGSVILTINQIDAILSGAITPKLWLKIALTPCVPFCVSLYGAYIAYCSALAREQAMESA